MDSGWSYETDGVTRWSPSQPDVLKLNMDAALKSWWELGFL